MEIVVKTHWWRKWKWYTKGILMISSFLFFFFSFEVLLLLLLFLVYLWLNMTITYLTIQIIININPSKYCCFASHFSYTFHSCILSLVCCKMMMIIITKVKKDIIIFIFLRVKRQERKAKLSRKCMMDKIYEVNCLFLNKTKEYRWISCQRHFLFRRMMHVGVVFFFFLSIFLWISMVFYFVCCFIHSSKI